MSRFPLRAVFAISDRSACTHKRCIIRRVFVCCIHFIRTLAHIYKYTYKSRWECGRRALTLELKTTSLFSLKHDCRNQKHKCLKALAAIKKRASFREMTRSRSTYISYSRRAVPRTKKEKQDLVRARYIASSSKVAANGRIVKWHVILKRVLSLSLAHCLDYII